MTTTVNHHAGHPVPTGVPATLIAVSMLVGREHASRLALDLARPEPTDVLDRGCGPGVTLRLAARRARRVVGVDPSPTMLRWARRVTRGMPVELRAGRAELLPIDDAEVDVVFAVSTVHHWDTSTSPSARSGGCSGRRGG